MAPAWLQTEEVEEKRTVDWTGRWQLAMALAPTTCAHGQLNL